jgi:hypothetical protein
MIGPTAAHSGNVRTSPGEGRLAYLSLIDFVPGHEPYEHPRATRGN